MTNTTRNEARLTRKRITEWMQEIVDFMVMSAEESAEIEGSAFAGVIQTQVNAFAGSAQRDLGITLNTYGFLDRTFWTAKQHDDYQRTVAPIDVRRLARAWYDWLEHNNPTAHPWDSLEPWQRTEMIASTEDILAAAYAAEPQRRDQA